MQQKAVDSKVSGRDTGDQQPQQNVQAGDDAEHREQQFAGRQSQKHRRDSLRFEHVKHEQEDQGGEQRQQVVQHRQRDEENEMRQQRHGRKHTSSARSGARLAEHPDCADDVHRYCKRSNLHNFAVVECLQDDVGVSNIIIFIISRSSSSSVSLITHFDVDIDFRPP